MAWLEKSVPWIVNFTCNLLLLILLSSQTVQVSAEFKFLSPPGLYYVVPYDSSFEINCTTNDANATTTLYYRSRSRGSIWVQRTVIIGKLVKFGHVYTVLDFGTDDEGEYQCRARNRSGDTIRHDAGNVFGKPNLVPPVNVEPKHEAVLTAGQFYNITCSSLYGTTLEWFKKQKDDGTDIPISRDKTYSTDDKTMNNNKLVLMIKNAQKSDSGSYKCLMMFSGNTNDKFVSLTVYETVVPAITKSSASPFAVIASNQTTLFCVADGYPQATISWYKDGKQITIPDCTLSQFLTTCKNKKYKLTSKPITKHTKINGSLTIFDTNFLNDQGRYTCKAVNTQGEVNRTIDVNVKDKPTLVQKTQFWQLANLPAQVKCLVKSSSPLPSFTWDYQSCFPGQVNCPLTEFWSALPPSQTVLPSPGVNTSYSLVKVTKDIEAAFYRCTARNAYGTDSLVLTFRRIDKGGVLIQIKSHTKPLVTIAKETFKLPCVARRGDVQWLKDGRVLSTMSDPRVNITKMVLDEKFTKITLTVMNATVNDSGVYTCDAVFLKPQIVNDSIAVIVKGRVKPNITGLVSQEVREQFPGYVEFVCEATTANPKATINWNKKQGGGWRSLERQISKGLSSTTECKTRTTGFYVIRDDNSHLVICKPKHNEHTGWYQCTAENTEGRDEKEARLYVLASPKIINPKHGENLLVGLGTSINVTCSATGNPLPDVVWTRTDDPNRKVLSSGRGKALLKVKDVQEKDLGNYTCNATNTIMFDTAVFTIKEYTEGAPFKGKKVLTTEALIGIICACIASILIGSIICFIVYRRQKKQIDEYKELYFLRTGSSDYKIDPDRSLLEQCSNLPYDLDWEFPEERLILGEPLGSGAFGLVLKAEAIGMPAFKPRDKTPDGMRQRSKLRRSMRGSRKKSEYSSMRTAKQTVAVKCLKEGASQSDYKDLASELKILIHLGEHKNIVNVLGACTRGRRLLMIIEYAPHGNLLSFLRARRDIYDANWVKTSNNPDQEFTLVDLGMAAYQISRGMEFLASKRCVHRDLAARNVLVGGNYVMKISDFGLARDIYQDDLYVKTTTGLLPVKWMSMESLFDRVYTIKSDVWSFGIMLWEIFTLGGTPYPGIPTEQLLDYLSEGNRMKQPQGCPLEMYAIMRDCWIEAPEQRPTFAAIAERLGKILEKNVTKDNPYVHLEVDEDSGASNYYLTPCESVCLNRKTTDGYEDPVPSLRPQPPSTSYNSPLPVLPSNGPEEEPGNEMPNSPLPPIPTPQQYQSGSESSNESGIEIGDREKDRIEGEQREPLILRLDEEPTSPERKGKKEKYKMESAV